jgi:lipid A 4'-phosphatase
MILIPIIGFFSLFFLLKQKKKVRIRLAVIGLLIGPLIGCGLIANLYFKETWGRARPVHIVEFGGDKQFSNPFSKSDQCVTNCSWISGETSGAFSFMVGTIILRNHIFFILNWILGFLVFFCRLSMGGHFFSDNLFALFFMLYLAFGYRYLVYLYMKNSFKR